MTCLKGEGLAWWLQWHQLYPLFGLPRPEAPPLNCAWWDSSLLWSGVEGRDHPMHRYWPPPPTPFRVSPTPNLGLSVTLLLLSPNLSPPFPLYPPRNEQNSLWAYFLTRPHSWPLYKITCYTVIEASKWVYKALILERWLLFHPLWSLCTCHKHQSVYFWNPWTPLGHTAVGKANFALIFYSPFPLATDKDCGQFLELNCLSFNAVAMIFCLNFSILQWIEATIILTQTKYLQHYNIYVCKLSLLGF